MGGVYRHCKRDLIICQALSWIIGLGFSMIWRYTHRNDTIGQSD
jgi:hypothetical protein